MVKDDSFEQAFDRLFLRSYRHALRLVGNSALAEDLAAEGLAITYSHWGRVRSYDYLDSWVLRVVTNLAIDSFSKRKADLRRDEPLQSEDAAVLRITLANALAALPRRQRDAIVLRYLVDMSETEVAATLGIAPGTVKAHLHRGVAHLRRSLGPAYDFSVPKES